MATDVDIVLFSLDQSKTPWEATATEELEFDRDSNINLLLHDAIEQPPPSIIFVDREHLWLEEADRCFFARSQYVTQAIGHLDSSVRNREFIHKIRDLPDDTWLAFQFL